MDLRKIFFPAEFLELDDIGYYKPKVLGGLPSESTFYEDYPISSEAWHYNNPMCDPNYEFEEPDTDFKRTIAKDQDRKQLLDQKMQQAARKAKEFNDSI